MALLTRLRNVLRRWFHWRRPVERKEGRAASGRDREFRRIKCTVVYSTVKVVDTQDEAAEAAREGNTLALIRGGIQGAKWLVMICPCGCGEIRRISLSKHIQPAWTLMISEDNEISLRPSVYLRGDCHAHFVLRDNVAYVY